MAVVTTRSTPLRSHAFRIIPPQATEKYQMPNSCQNGGCHEDKDLQWAKESFNEYYHDYNNSLDANTDINE
ncbi:MAG: hypothetical protein KZQ74_11630 [gamma proteobacterium symbiont of Bathyaustriella thionipta]|nr:hypothetical protein [gamma proteobacterium symbiont of Bathyaustriella thionipta]MCU7951521.1 hypothetical protein [gamma proteobacterium symbiont of Bathyaustriella thionipta]MCU7958094.1 hypothetical protein [gamma proteobacterium symbiont of Bathyaustriella thionipta]MCU7967824.1 hypothetical protein [gamma proteobacterium symbiont of Bathyaustriella thionipta]